MSEERSFHNPSSGDDGVSRRRLIRAGLSAAPVMMAFKSQSVLAADHICIKPSAFSSVAAAQKASVKMSHAPNSTNTCLSPGYWKNHDHPAPYTVQANSFFLKPTGLTLTAGVADSSGKIWAGFSGSNGTSFVAGTTSGTTLFEVLNTGGGTFYPLARHLVGCFLTAVQYGDTNSASILTQAKCIEIWNTGGNCLPFAGAPTSWVLQDWLDYFTYVFGP